MCQIAGCGVDQLSSRSLCQITLERTVTFYTAACLHHIKAPNRDLVAGLQADIQDIDKFFVEYVKPETVRWPGCRGQRYTVVQLRMPGIRSFNRARTGAGNTRAQSCKRERRGYPHAIVQVRINRTDQWAQR